MLFALYSGSEVFEIVERDDGYIEAMSAKGYLSEYKDWSQIEQRAMEFAKGKILDVGCGAGRHSLCLQNKGFNITGIDISPLAVKVCKLRGLKKVKHTSVEKADFKPDTFDRIFMMGNNFGLFANFKKSQTATWEIPHNDFERSIDNRRHKRPLQDRQSSSSSIP